MYPYTAQESATAIRNAKNPNSALKNYLKQGLGQADPSAARFIKDLRETVGLKRPEQFERLIESGHEKYSMHVLGVIRMAYAEAIDPVIQSVVEKYADEFNATFEKNDNVIKVKDEAKFKAIFTEAGKVFAAGIAEKKLTPAGLMKNVMIVTLFDADVVSKFEELGLF